ncbi:MAG: MoaD/ThiS family protein [Chloroflexi bacterium]|nr:MoaD/ThiS family protein [Chloroflexota bacterium]
MEIQLNYIGPVIRNGLPRREKVVLDDGSSLADLLARIDELHDGAFSSLARDSEARIISQIKILVDGKEVDSAAGLQSPLTVAREVTIIFITPVGGG